MIVTPVVRRKAFRAALAISGMNVRQWAVEQGLTDVHVRAVLNGRRKSKKLDEEMYHYAVRVLLPFVDDFRSRSKAA